MEKNVMVSLVISKLKAIGVTGRQGGTTDISINQEFLDAKWKLGNKKLNYQATAFFNEKDKTIYFWGLTKETSSGLSFGGEGEILFQSGKTLFRKIKSVQCDNDGNIYEIDLDLGLITNAFKEIANENGWSFKTVLKREKARYPAVNVVVEPKQEKIKQQHKVSDDDGEQSSCINSQDTISPIKAQKKSSLFFFAPFILLAMITVLLYTVGGITILGWELATLIFAFVLFNYRKFLARGYLIQVIMWISMIFLLFIIMGIAVPEDSNFLNNRKVTG